MNLKGLAFALRVFLIAFMCGGVSCLWAQSSTTGGLTGAVLDSTGAAVPGTTVTLVNRATNQTQTTTTDANGGYGFSLLPTGTYGAKRPFVTASVGLVDHRPRRLNRPSPEKVGFLRIMRIR